MIHTRISKELWLFSSCLLFSFFGFTQNNEVSLLFVGDVMQHDGQIEAAYNLNNNSYEYEDGFKFVKPIINSFDIAVANLEVTLAGKPYKGYPQFSAPDELAETLINSGFNVILTSNNHSCDRGAKGVLRTLDRLDELGVQHTGTFRNQTERDEKYPLMIEANNLKIAMLNYTYGTNGLEVEKPLIINYIDSAQIKTDIQTAKERGADYIICHMHWGTEYKFLPNNYQKKYEALCYRNGANMVIGGHPHVVQPIVKKSINNEDKLTVWSLGNFVSNMQTRPTRGGLMVGATIKKEGQKIAIKNVEHYLVYVLKKKEGEVTQYYILPDFNYNAARPNFMDSKNTTYFKNFMEDSRALFTKYNRGTSETIIENTSDIGKLYTKFLSGYYSVALPSNNDDLLSNDQLAPYLHETIDFQGNNTILSGVCYTKAQAFGNAQFLRDCGIRELKLVKVTPGKIEVINE
ncbi:CapA family protein [Crocinitomicaceae bacterium]|nr:CapA family protein [Crocinitomicaceae bacterium]